VDPTVIYWYPTVDNNPAPDPMIKAPNGRIIKLATAPTATPPAKVAFWMWTMLILFSGEISDEIANVKIQEPDKDNTVLITARC